MVVAYFIAQYIEFSAMGLVYEDGQPVGFWEYFDFATRSLSFKSDNGKPGDELGALGYGVRLLEIAGFSIGGLLPLVWLRAKPYCQQCQRYMKTRWLCMIPAAPLKPKAKNFDGKSPEQRQQEATQEAQATMDGLAKAIKDGDTETFRRTVASLQAMKKETAKRNVRIELSLCHCPTCADGYVRLRSATGQGNKIDRKDMFNMPASPQFIQDYLSLPATAVAPADAVKVSEPPNPYAQ